MEFIEKDDNITKISQVTPEVALFLRQLGFSNYYIIKIFALVGDAAIAADGRQSILAFGRISKHEV